MAKEKTTHLSKRDLEARLAELEHEYDVARSGLLKGVTMTIVSIFAGLATISAALWAFLERGPGFLSGSDLVVIFGVIVLGLVIYFSFVFGRTAKLRADISKTKKELEASSGKSVR